MKSPESSPVPSSQEMSRGDFLTLATGVGLSFLLGFKAGASKRFAEPNSVPIPSHIPLSEKKKSLEKTPEQKLQEQVRKKVAEEAQKIFEINDYNHLIEACERVKSYSESVEKYSSQYGIDPKVMYAIIFTESKGKTDAISSAGAAGLCQITTIAAKELGLEINPENDFRLDPVKSIEATAKLLQKYQSGNYNYSVDQAISSYNFGPTSMNRLIIEHEQLFPKEKNSNYPKIYFDLQSKPDFSGYDYLFNEIGDEGANYYFCVLAADEILNSKPEEIKVASDKFM